MTGGLTDFISERVRGDRVVWVVVFLLVLTSSVSVYSASATLAWKAGGDSVGILVRHMALLGIGIGTKLSVGTELSVGTAVGIAHSHE